MKIEKAKKIIYEIKYEFEKENKIKVELYPVTGMEYIKHVLNKNINTYQTNRFKNLIHSISDTLTMFAYNNKNNVIIIFLNNILSSEEEYFLDLFKIVFTTYHELAHSLQNKTPENSYAYILNHIDCNMLLIPDDYNKNHDSYSFEIGANLYAIRKTREYLRKKEPIIYNLLSILIDDKEKEFIQDYLKYNLCDNIERLIRVKKNIPGALKKENIFLFDLFFDKKFNYKPLTEILKNPNINNIDKSVVYSFLSTKTFLESIDLSILTKEELSILKDAIEYTDTIYNNQRKYLLPKEIKALNKINRLEKKQGLKYLIDYNLLKIYLICLLGDEKTYKLININEVGYTLKKIKSSFPQNC